MMMKYELLELHENDQAAYYVKHEGPCQGNIHGCEHSSGFGSSTCQRSALRERADLNVKYKKQRRKTYI